MSAPLQNPASQALASAAAAQQLLALCGFSADCYAPGEVRFGDQLVHLCVCEGRLAFEFEVGALGTSEGYACATQHLFVRYAKSADDAKAWQYAKAIAARLAGYKFADLDALLRPGSRPRDAQEQDGNDSVEAQYPTDQLDSHHEASWWRFNYPFQRVGYKALRHGVRWARVHHASLECASGTGGRLLASCRYFRSEPEGPSFVAQEVSTVLGQADVHGGRTQDRLQETVQSLLGRFDVVEIQTTCLPDLLGDQPGALPALDAAPDGTKVFWQCKTDDEDRRLLRQHLRERLAHLAAPEPRVAHHLILLGADAAVQRDLCPLLSALGVAIERTLLPDIDFFGRGARSDAALCAWADPRGWDWIDVSPLYDAFEVVQAPAPFGLAATGQWLRRVAAAAGVNDADARVAAHLDALRPQTAPLRDRCRRHRIALCGTPDDMRALFAQIEPFCTPALLAEMGFALRVLVYGDARDCVPVGQDGDVEVVSFATRAELDARLRDVSLALTSFQHDTRLASHALHGFDPSVFSVGFAGALRTAERLLRLCERRPFAGHRACLRTWVE